MDIRTQCDNLTEELKQLTKDSKLNEVKSVFCIVFEVRVFENPHDFSKNFSKELILRLSYHITANAE